MKPGAGPHHRALPGRAPAGHHRPGHRPHLRGQDEPRGHQGPGPLRRVDPATEGPLRPGPEERPVPQDLQPPRHQPRRRRRRSAVLRRARAPLLNIIKNLVLLT